MTTATTTSVPEGVAVILPPEALQRLNVAAGDQVGWIETANGIQLFRMDAELSEQVRTAEQVMREDDDALRQLSK